MFFEKIVHILFPERRNQKYIAGITSLTPKNNTVNLCGIDVGYFFSYQDPEIRALIQEAKFHNSSHAQKLLGTTLRSMLPTQEAHIVIPMPLSNARLRERGYNQIAEILRAGNIAFEPKLITRKHKQPQTNLTREQRLHNQENTFLVTAEGKRKIPKAHILLIDDVVTTGATMNAAQAALAPHHPTSITCIALAH